MGTMQKGTRRMGAGLALALLLSGCSLTPWIDDGSAIAQTARLTYPIVDTGQVEFYGNTSVISEPSVGDAFYGQDAQIDGNQPSYAVNADGTVTDLVTGLTWTQAYYGKMTYSEAVAMADSFQLAGYSDWRLPTIKELYSLIDFSGEDVSPESGEANNPFIDTDVFDFAYGDTSAGERIIDSQWATTSLYTGDSEFAGGSQLMFGVNFADGRIKGYPVQGSFYVRLVRGNTAYGENDYIDNRDGTITDRATGLMWSQDDSGSISSSGGTANASNGGAMNWEEALAYVQQLNDANYLGYSDWSLPNTKELQSIVDYDRSPDATSSAAIDPIFHVTSMTNEDGELDWGFYWTGTTHASARGAQAAVYIAFGRGLGYMNGRYMDVHGAGCQRSDPKSGSAEPTGRGPQGDVVRVNNFVRVVRNVGSTSNTSLGSSEIPNSNVVRTDPGADDAFAGEENYVLFAPLNGTTAYLIDRAGNVVHDWELSGRPGNSVYLLEGGDLLATYTIHGSISAGGVGGGVQQLTGDGTEVWSFELASDNAQLHHDVERLPNGNVLMISWEVVSRADALAAGLSANQLPDSGEVWSEMIVEYDPDAGHVIWEWHLWDHRLPEGWDASDHPEKIDLRYFANPKSPDWWHVNAVDYSAELDQIILSSRAASEFWIIDHDLTSAAAAGDAGDLLYRWGNPAAYDGSGSQELVDQHDSEWIDENTILVFDNGNPRNRPYSRVVEIDLPEYENGQFEDATIVWEYGAASGDEHFFADHISGAQRLETGNTLICSGTEGRFFEVTPAGETVWEYVNPYTSTGPGGRASNEVFRCEAYSAAFVGEGLADASAGKPTPNVVSGTPPTSGAGTPTSPGPSGIESISPSNLTAGTDGQALTIRLDPQLSPPPFVAFSRVAIGGVKATTWSRSGDTVWAHFEIPASLRGSQLLTVSFPGRNGHTVVLRHPIEVR